MDFVENYVWRIEFDFDYTKYTDEQHLLSRELLAAGERQFNASCNNLFVRIKELKLELSSATKHEQERRNQIKQQITQIRRSIAHAKREAAFRDYGLLKRRVFYGASTDDLYPMMPYFYAEAYDLDRRIMSQRKDGDGGDGPIGRIFKWLGYLVILERITEMAADALSRFFERLSRLRMSLTVEERTAAINVPERQICLVEVPHATPPTPTN